MISQKMLAGRLEELERPGLITKKEYKTILSHVEYTLSQADQLLSPILEQLSDCGDEVRPLINI